MPPRLSPNVIRYLQEVDAICARPVLSDPADRKAFLYRLQAQWTRYLGLLHRQGRAAQFTGTEMSDILDEINARIDDLRAAARSPNPNAHT